MTTDSTPNTALERVKQIIDLIADHACDIDSPFMLSDAELLTSLVTAPLPASEGWQEIGSGMALVPRDDVSRPVSDSALPPQMIYAGIAALDRAEDDLANYVPGETPDWDHGMEAVAVYRAMVAAAPPLREGGEGKEDGPASADLSPASRAQEQVSAGDREITHGEAKSAALRLIAGAFRRDGERLESARTPRFSIPCRPDQDDDCLIIAYIDQQQAHPTPDAGPSLGDGQ